MPQTEINTHSSSLMQEVEKLISAADRKVEENSLIRSEYYRLAQDYRKLQAEHARLVMASSGITVVVEPLRALSIDKVASESHNSEDSLCCCDECFKPLKISA